MTTEAATTRRPTPKNPKRPFKPQGMLRKFWGCHDEEVLLEGPAGTGKTRCGLEKAFLMAMKYAGCRILFVRKTRESMTQTVLQIFEEWVIPEGSYLLEGPSRKMRENYILKNGSEIVIAGLDKPEKVMSAEYDAIFCFEATELTEADYELLNSRIGRGRGVIPYEQIVCDCNPGAPSHWLNRLALAGRMTRFPTRHTDNPVFFDIAAGKFLPAGERYINRLRRVLSGARLERLLNGKWRVSEGAVYPEFDNALHIIPQMPEGWEKWRRVRSIDFGTQNPFVCLWGAVDHDGDIYIYRQIYMSNRTVREHASGVWDKDPDTGLVTMVHPGIKQLSAEDGKVEITVADHDLGDRLTLEKEGVDTVPAFKDINQGIEAVKLRLRPSLHGDGSIRPRLYFLADSLVERDLLLIENKHVFSMEEEFSSYRYKDAKEGRAKDEEPLDKDNHAMDALRYLVAYVDDIGGSLVEIYAEEGGAVEEEQYRQW